MCLKSPSESGQPCGFVPCAEYRKVKNELACMRKFAEKLAVQRNDANSNELLLEAENAKLRAEIDRRLRAGEGEEAVND